MSDRAEIPKYRCRGTIGALRIKDVTGPDRATDDGSKMLVFDDNDAIRWRVVDREFFSKHNIKVGDYYVTYPGLAVTIYPAKVFEDNYELIGGAG